MFALKFKHFNYNLRVIMAMFYRHFIWFFVICGFGAAVAFFLVGRDFFHPGGEIIFENEARVDEKEGNRIRFFGNKADSLNLVTIEESLKNFMRDHKDVTITYESVKGRPYWPTLEKRAASGLLDDIMVIDRERVQNFSSRGYLTNLADFDGLDGFEGWVREQFTNPDGSVYFLPTCVTAYALWINYDLLKEHGFSIPSNLDEFSAVCEYFVKHGIVPIIANNFRAIPSIIVSGALFPLYHGGNSAELIRKLNNGEGSVAEQLRPGMEMAAMMIRRGWIDGKTALKTAQTSDDLHIFARGENPFMLTGAWASPRIAALKPDFEYAAHPLPILPDGAVLPIELDICVGVNAASVRQDILKDFVEYLIQPNVLRKYGDSQSSFSPLSDKAPPPDEAIATLTEALENGRFVLSDDFRLKLPVRSALYKCSEALLKGADANAATELLAELLAGKAG